MWKLTVHEPGNSDARVYRPAPGRYVIGKGAGCDLRIENAYISRRHAALEIRPDGLVLRDLDSTNGSWLPEQERLEGERVFQGEGRVRLGHEVTLEFSPVAGEGGEAAPSPPRSIDGLSVAGSATAEAPPPPIPAPGESVAAAEPSRAREAAVNREVQDKILERMNLKRRGDIGALSYHQLREETRRTAQTLIDEGEIEVPSRADREALISSIVAEAIGFGPIEPFLDDESVTEVMVNGPHQVYVERKGRIEQVKTTFSSEQALMNVIERIVTPLGRRIDEGNPMIDARLPDGSRVNAIIPPLALCGPTLTIRKFTRDRFTMEDMVRTGTLSPEMAQFLRVCVQYRRNIIVSGGTGSGKTTTLNSLSDYIPPSDRIVTIEDSAELRLGQPHVVSLESRPANVEGKGEVSIRDLVRNSLRMRPDRIVIGECRGGEALDMLQAMNTGHDGSLTTGHANSPRDMLARLETMVMMSGLELPSRAIREQVASAVEIMVQQMRMSDGSRRIVSIVEVGKLEGDIISLQEIFRFRQNGVAGDGRVMGRFEGCGYAPSFYQTLADAGIDLDWDIFDGPVSAAAIEEG